MFMSRPRCGSELHRASKCNAVYCTAEHCTEHCTDHCTEHRTVHGRYSKGTARLARTAEPLDRP
jgi:hypothetical protein